jgi:hypothetical protein
MDGDMDYCKVCIIQLERPETRKPLNTCICGSEILIIVHLTYYTTHMRNMGNLILMRKPYYNYI